MTALQAAIGNRKAFRDATGLGLGVDELPARDRDVRPARDELAALVGEVSAMVEPSPDNC
jgi:hypothetical protein